MKTFRRDLAEALRDPAFRKHYDEERSLARLALALHDLREAAGLSQGQVARRAKLTQQQVSLVENGANCTIATYLRVSRALGARFSIGARARRLGPNALHAARASRARARV